MIFLFGCKFFELELTINCYPKSLTAFHNFVHLTREAESQNPRHTIDNEVSLPVVPPSEYRQSTIRDASGIPGFRDDVADTEKRQAPDHYGPYSPVRQFFICVFHLSFGGHCRADGRTVIPKHVTERPARKIPH